MNIQNKIIMNLLKRGNLQFLKEWRSNLPRTRKVKRDPITNTPLCVRLSIRLSPGCSLWTAIVRIVEIFTDDVFLFSLYKIRILKINKWVWNPSYASPTYTWPVLYKYAHHRKKKFQQQFWTFLSQKTRHARKEMSIIFLLHYSSLKLKHD